MLSYNFKSPLLLPPSYHPRPPSSRQGKKTAKNSDHDIIIFAPKTDSNFKVVRKKKIIKSRPLPDSVIHAFGKEFQN